MAGILVRTLIIALGLGLASVLIPGVEITGAGTLIVAALLLGLVNAIIRPLFILLTLPITLLTLGLFLLVVNAAMFGLVAAMLDGFAVSGFFAAVFGAIVVSLVSMVASWTIGPDGRYEIMIIERRDD
ncbi:MAG: phage holin family protein [Gammaproteobacteria bacterium]|nr:phage holin family protein [Gammaproteobacteria bacterium]